MTDRNTPRRRGLLKGLNLNSPIESLIHRSALVVPPTMGREMVLQLMVANKIQQIPVVDERQIIVGLHLWDEITTTPKRSNLMIIMAGGKGTRLRPFTENCPKPLVALAGKPMLEHIIERGVEKHVHSRCTFVRRGQGIESIELRMRPREAPRDRWEHPSECLHEGLSWLGFTVS